MPQIWQWSVGKECLSVVFAQVYLSAAHTHACLCVYTRQCLVYQYPCARAWDLYWDGQVKVNILDTLFSIKNFEPRKFASMCSKSNIISKFCFPKEFLHTYASTVQGLGLRIPSIKTNKQATTKPIQKLKTAENNFKQYSQTSGISVWNLLKVHENGFPCGGPEVYSSSLQGCTCDLCDLCSGSKNPNSLFHTNIVSSHLLCIISIWESTILETNISISDFCLQSLCLMGLLSS